MSLDSGGFYMGQARNTQALYYGEPGIPLGKIPAWQGVKCLVRGIPPYKRDALGDKRPSCPLLNGFTWLGPGGNGG